jgi:hypothetical protein
VTSVSRFNRLVVMVTHQQSWHSVSRNDMWLRMIIRKVFPQGVKQNPRFCDKGGAKREDGGVAR